MGAHGLERSETLQKISEDLRQVVCALFVGQRDYHHLLVLLNILKAVLDGALGGAQKGQSAPKGSQRPSPANAKYIVGAGGPRGEWTRRRYLLHIEPELFRCTAREDAG